MYKIKDVFYSLEILLFSMTYCSKTTSKLRKNIKKKILYTNY